jgi:methionyl-tRNA synthetase
MTSRKRVLVTAALPYSNGRLHVGHIVGAYLPSDTYVRFLRLRGIPVKFICGSDDHGVAIMLTAQKEGKTPAEVAKFYNESQKRAFDGLRIEFDTYSSTSRNPHHAGMSQDFFKRMLDKGFFEKKSTRQFYDPKTETFLPDRFVKGACGYCGTVEQNGDQCESCGKMLDVENLKDARSVMSGEPAMVRDTVHWFLDLSKFQSQVGEWLGRSVVREHTKKYVEGLIGNGFVKRSMTRDISWGVPLPLTDPEAKGKVLYVWFDAPIGYISNTKEVCAEAEGDAEKYREWWQSDDTEIYHFIGEDNTIFHCMVWIAMLLAEGSYKLPKGVIVNQFMNIQFPGQEEQKISKSRGTAVWIEEYLENGGDPDALRYYLTMIATERSKSTYQTTDLIQRQNSELANVIGNFVNRILSFTIKNYGPAVPEQTPGKLTPVDAAFTESLVSTHAKVTESLEAFNFKTALEQVMEFARACNKYVDDKAPWTSKKTDAELTKTTLNIAIQAIRALGVMLTPFMPTTGERMVKMLGLDPKTVTWEQAVQNLPAGHALGQPEILFQKIETEKA